MALKLSPWCRRVKIRLLELDMSVNDLAEALGMARTYLSSIINGRVKSEAAIKKISDYLQISDADSDLEF